MKMRVPAWTSTMASLTLLALASSLPEIFLSSLGIFTAEMGGVPSTLGPMSLAGSSAFNLLIVAAIAVAFASKLNAISSIGVFLTTAVFATTAYVWLYTVLAVTSPGYITFSEALATLAMYPGLLVLAHAVDKCTVSKDEIEDSRRQVCKHTLQCLAEEHGQEHVLAQATGVAGEEADLAEQSRIQQYFKVCLGENDLNKVPLEKLV